MLPWRRRYWTCWAIRIRKAGAGSPKPAYPFLEVARHDSEPVSSAGFEASVHRIDLRVESRDPSGAAAREAIAAVRSALSGDEPEMEGWRCVMMAPVFSDFVQMRFGFWRALLRVKAILEPA